MKGKYNTGVHSALLAAVSRWTATPSSSAEKNAASISSMPPVPAPAVWDAGSWKHKAK